MPRRTASRQPPRQAIRNLLVGAGETPDGGQDFIGIREERGLPICSHPVLAAELRKLGVAIRGVVIPSVRGLREVES